VTTGNCPFGFFHAAGMVSPTESAGTVASGPPVEPVCDAFQGRVGTVPAVAVSIVGIIIVAAVFV
jgi:hypothetical protein